MTEAILAGLEGPPDVIVAANDDMALGAMQVAQERGLDVPIIGFDALPEALAAVQSGGLAATIEQFPGGQTERALAALLGFSQRHQARAADPARAGRDNGGEHRPGRAAGGGTVAAQTGHAPAPPNR